MNSCNKKLRILIADDHELVRNGIQALLRADKNFDVVAQVGNGKEAVERAELLQPDLAIVDITMPVLDGLEATSRIRNASPNTRILVLTMHESDQMVRRVLGAGATGYVLKSDLAHQLVRAVRSVAQGKVFLTPAVSQIVLDSFLQAKREPQPFAREEYAPSARETEVIRLLAQGSSNKQIALLLGIAVRTVETHRAKIMLKLGLHSIVELVHYADNHGMRN